MLQMKEYQLRVYYDFYIIKLSIKRVVFSSDIKCNINVILKLIPGSTYLLLKNSDSLIFERFAEFDKLGTFRIDCQRCNDHVGLFVYYLADKTSPLFPSSAFGISMKHGRKMKKKLFKLLIFRCLKIRIYKLKRWVYMSYVSESFVIFSFLKKFNIFLTYVCVCVCVAILI